MTWVTLEDPRTIKAKAPRLSLSTKRGNGRMRLTIPTSMCCKLGLDKPDHVALQIGKDENEGRLRMVASEQGGYKVGRLKHAVVIAFPVPPGVTLKDNDGPLDYRVEPDQSVIFQLPQWARPGIYTVTDETTGKPVAADKSKPGSLEIQGNDLIMGGARLKLTKSQAGVMQLLVDNFGQLVRKQQILDHLYSLDPNGGADEKIVDVWICKIRSRLEDEKVGLSIITHRGAGYELRRPVAG